jgi:hypothetical protein
MQKSDFVESKKNIIITFGLLFLLGLGIRLYFTPFHIPISLDGIDYFAYAIAMSREGIFPSGYILTNFGWPSFVSIFFTFAKDADMLTLMDLQRILSVIISTLTIIPIYFLTKIFFKKQIALLATILFLFDPRIIQNSIAGITDSLFILLTVLTLLFIFYKKSSLIYLSFIFVALAAFVRYEGIVLIIPLLVSYVLKNKQEKIPNIKLLVGISLFLIIIIPINFINYEDTQQTSIFSQIVHRGDFISGTIIENKPDIDDEFFATNENHTIIFIENAVGGFVKYLGWVLIPTSIVFCILGVIFVPKKVTKNKIIFGLFFVFLALASVLAYGRGFQETRYLLVLLPIITLLSCYGLNYLLKSNLKNVVVIIIFAIISSSFIFIDYRNQDSKYELEMYEATIFLTNIAQGVNDYSGNQYVKVANLQNNWPELLDKGINGKMELVTKKFVIKGFNEPEEYIKLNKNKGLTHLLVNENDKFFEDVYINEKNYSNLEKIYDSNNFNKNIKYKIFKINNEE